MKSLRRFRSAPRFPEMQTGKYLRPEYECEGCKIKKREIERLKHELSRASQQENSEEQNANT